MHGQRIHELIREDDAADSVEVFFGYPMDGTFEPGQLFFLTGAHGGTRLDYRVLQALEGFGRFGCECLENVKGELTRSGSGFAQIEGYGRVDREKLERLAKRGGKHPTKRRANAAR